MKLSKKTVIEAFDNLLQIEFERAEEGGHSHIGVMRDTLMLDVVNYISQVYHTEYSYIPSTDIIIERGKLFPDLL